MVLKNVQRWIAVGAPLVIVVPFLAAMPIGALTETVKGVGTHLGGFDVFRHNLTLGLVIVVSGWLTFGIAPIGIGAVGSISTGYAVGAYVHGLGWQQTFALLPHLFPEMLSFILFALVGMQSAAIGTSFALQKTPLRITDSYVLTVNAALFGAVLLVCAAGLLEATVLI
ncbi:stage II sporulation protein M [Neomicrococcus lactis]